MGNWITRKTGTGAETETETGKRSSSLEIDVYTYDRMRTEEAARCQEGCSQSGTLSTPLDCLNLPPHLKQTIWTNSNSILADNHAIVQAPGNSKAYIVKGMTGQKPHFVQPSKTGGGFLCDA